MQPVLTHMLYQVNCVAQHTQGLPWYPAGDCGLRLLMVDTECQKGPV